LQVIFDSYKGKSITPTGVIHILSDGTLDSSFGTVTDVLDNIQVLKKRGSRLYVGGYFSTIQGVSRPYLAALNATTGALDSWTPDVPNSGITKIDANDSLVFIQGNFSYIGGTYVPYNFAALKAIDGKLVKGFSNRKQFYNRL